MIYESIKMVFKVFRTNKMRTFLTMLGIIIGIFSITIIFSISSATKNSINSELEKIDFSEIYVQVNPTIIDDEVFISIPTYEIESLKDEECIEAVLQNKNYQFKEAKKYYGASVEEWNYPTCTGVSYESLKDLKMIAGRKFTKMDEDNRMPFCIIDPEVANKVLGNFQDSKDILDKSITINGLDFKIVGVYENENNFGGAPTIYVLNSYAKDYFSSSNSSDYQGLDFTVKPISKEAREEAVDIVRNKLLEYMSANEFYIQEDYSSIMEQETTIIGIIELVFAGIAGLSLLVGGIGIMNIMLVSVNERIKEIGIRMALGANSGNIKMQFLIEGVMLTLISGIIGMLFASGAISIVNSFIKSSEQFSELGFSLGVDIGVMLKTVAFCGIIGIIFGLYPAKKASELNPIDALRYE